MKHLTLLLSLLCVLLTSCGGSHIMRVEDFSQVTCEYDEMRSQQAASLFSIVPGEYKVHWTVVERGVPYALYQFEIPIRLRLNRRVELTDRFLFERNYLNFPYEFFLINDDGVELRKSSLHFRVAMAQYLNGKSNVQQHYTHPDQYSDLVDFLRSEPGTEATIVVSALGTWDKNDNNVLAIKHAQGIGMHVMASDAQFEDRVGEFK